MAITKTVFTSTDVTSSLSEVGEWLTDNAAVLGFAVSTDESGNVICTSANGTNFLKFTKDPSYLTVDVAITLTNGETKDSITKANATAWTSGYSGANGLALFAQKKDRDNPHHVWVFIGKTESGGLCVVCQSNKTDDYEFLRIVTADIEKGVAITSSARTDALEEIYPYDNGKAAVRTSYAPICLDSGDTAHETFFTPQTQYPMTSAEIKLGLETTIYDGKDEYVYSGIIAMKG